MNSTRRHLARGVPDRPGAVGGARRRVLVLGSLALMAGLGGCGVQGAPVRAVPNSPSSATTVSTPSGTTSVTTPAVSPSVRPPSESDAVVQAEHAFWADYANGDAASACSRSFGYAHGQVVSMQGDFLTECVSGLSAYPAAGTDLTVADAVVYGGLLALAAPQGQVCGAESLTPGGCSPVPDLAGQMPNSSSTTDFGSALSGVVDAWSTAAAGWTPDVLVKVGDDWHVLLPLADPVPVAPDTPVDGVLPTPVPDTSPKRPWTDQDWNDTCASGGCGAVPGLPPFHPGGGLSLG